MDARGQRIQIKDKYRISMEKILFETEDGEKQEFFVEEETRVGGVDYLLVTDSDGNFIGNANGKFITDTATSPSLRRSRTNNWKEVFP